MAELGFDPNAHRSNFIPYNKEAGWHVPGKVYDAIEAVLTPGLAYNGGNVSSEDAFNFAGNLMGGAVGSPNPGGAIAGMGKVAQFPGNPKPPIRQAIPASVIGNTQETPGFWYDLLRQFRQRNRANNMEPSPPIPDLPVHDPSTYGVKEAKYYSEGNVFEKPVPHGLTIDQAERLQRQFLNSDKTGGMSEHMFTRQINNIDLELTNAREQAFQQSLKEMRKLLEEETKRELAKQKAAKRPKLVYTNPDKP